MRDIRDAGQDAGFARQSAFTCPYAVGTPAWNAWMAGWSMGVEEADMRDIEREQGRPSK